MVYYAGIFRHYNIKETLVPHGVLCGAEAYKRNTGVMLDDFIQPHVWYDVVGMATCLCIVVNTLLESYKMIVENVKLVAVRASIFKPTIIYYKGSTLKNLGHIPK